MENDGIEDVRHHSVATITKIYIMDARKGAGKQAGLAGSKNGICYYFFENVNAYTGDMETPV